MDKEMVSHRSDHRFVGWSPPACPGDGSSAGAPGRPVRPARKDLLIVEAEASLVSDRGWLQDLGENLCHGSPVAAVGRRNLSGFADGDATSDLAH